MPRFQACVGPSGKRAHIRDKSRDANMFTLTLCKSTAPARDLKGKVSADLLCPNCMKRIEALTGETITAGLIGILEIT
jgi:hypothetical protein